MKRIALFLAMFLMIELVGIAQGQRATVYELGPQVLDTVKQSGGYQWRAYGFVYPRGTFEPKKDSCSSDTPRQSIGHWTAYGWKGNAGEHSATYRFVIHGEQFLFSGDVVAVDEEGFPASTLFDLFKILGGQIVNSDSPATAVYTPRSNECFGGELRVFQNETALVKNRNSMQRIYQK